MSVPSPRLGKFNARLLVPQESLLPHYGSEDAIVGEIVLQYGPDTRIIDRLAGKTVTTSDLFGPLKLEITLHGRLKLKVQGSGSTADRGCPILSKTFVVHQGSFRAEVGHEYRFPFSIHFPPLPGTIPPTFRMKFMARGCTLSVIIQYWLSAQLSVPGIEVKTKYEKTSEKPWVSYELSRPSLSTIRVDEPSFQHRVKIQNEYLLPDDLRPHGIRQKAKAAISSRHFPKLIFDVCCTDFQQICPEKPLNFEIAICPLDETSSGPFPDTSLDSFRVQLVALTCVQPGQASATKGSWSDRRTVQQFGSRRSLPMLILPGHENSTTITTDEVMHVPSSFRHSLVSRQYELVIDMTILIANEKVRVHRICPVIVTPPPREEPTRTSQALSAAQRSFLLSETSEQDEGVPAYDALQSGEHRASFSSGELPNLGPTSKLRPESCS